MTWKVSYAWHTIFVSSSCGIFVYKRDTSIATKIMSLPIFVFFDGVDGIRCILYVGLLFLSDRL